MKKLIILGVVTAILSSNSIFAMGMMNMGNMGGMMGNNHMMDSNTTGTQKVPVTINQDILTKLENTLSKLSTVKLKNLSKQVSELRSKITSGKVNMNNPDLVLLILDSIDQIISSKSSNNLSMIALAKDTPTVELKDGDSYNIDITYVKKNIGGNTLKMLAYNGSVPGPVIKVKQGSEISIKLTNKAQGIEVAMHSHGVRVDAQFDGVLKAMKGSQDPIKYGESYEYKLKFPDAGVFWYHPHMQEDMQQQLGLYGTFIVEPTESNYYSSVNKEESLMLGDILIQSGTNVPFDTNLSNYSLMGRYGNVLLINGKTDYSLNLNKGDVARFYITDTSNTRPYNFSISGAKLKLVGSDMSKYAKETYVDSIILSPGERYIVEAYFQNEGKYIIQNKTPDKIYDMGIINVSSGKSMNDYSSSFNTLRTNQELVDEFSKLSSYFDKNYDKKIDMQLSMKGMGMSGMMGMMNSMNMGDMMGHMNTASNIEWEDINPMENQMSNANMMQWKLVDADTSKDGEETNWTFNKGSLVKIRLYNDPNSMHPMQHPVHFHGQRFVVLSNNGQKNESLVWKDTVLVPAGEYVDVLLDASNPGQWMVHCHIAEHLSAGMLLYFNVR